MTLEGHEIETSTGIPKSYCLVFAATGKILSIGTESNRSNETGMSIENVETETSTDIPKPYCLVFTATGQEFAIRAESHRAYPIGMPYENKQWLHAICL